MQVRRATNAANFFTRWSSLLALECSSDASSASSHSAAASPGPGTAPGTPKDTRSAYSGRLHRAGTPTLSARGSAGTASPAGAGGGTCSVSGVNRGVARSVGGAVVAAAPTPSDVPSPGAQSPRRPPQQVAYSYSGRLVRAGTSSLSTGAGGGGRNSGSVRNGGSSGGDTGDTSRGRNSSSGDGGGGSSHGGRKLGRNCNSGSDGNNGGGGDGGAAATPSGQDWRRIGGALHPIHSADSNCCD